MPVLFVTYRNEAVVREFSKKIRKTLKEALGINDFIMHTKKKNEYDVLNSDIQISIFLHPTEERLRFSEDILAAKLQNNLNKESMAQHHVVAHLGKLGIKYFK